jgi:GTPase SAR1 family protein
VADLSLAGIAFLTKEEENVTFEIWGTGRLERYGVGMGPLYWRGARVILWTYDITNRVKS